MVPGGSRVMQSSSSFDNAALFSASPLSPDSLRGHGARTRKGHSQGVVVDGRVVGRMVCSMMQHQHRDNVGRMGMMEKGQVYGSQILKI